MPTYNGGSGGETISGSNSGDIINGNDGDDRLNGLGGHDTLNGGDDNDILDGGLGNDVLNGGNSYIYIGDTATYENAPGPVVVSLSIQGPQNTISYGTDTLIDIANLRGSSFNDILTGTNVDYLYAGSRLYGGPGDDTLYAGVNGAILEGGPGNDILDGTNGPGYAGYTEAPGGVTVDLGIAGPQNTGSDGIDTLINIQGVTGSDFDDVLRGGQFLDGGAGDDLLILGPNTNYLGGDGVDTISYEEFGSGRTINLPDPTPSLDRSVENVIGTAFGDVISGNSANNDLRGGDGNDRIAGGLGDDVYNGGAGRDVALLQYPPIDPNAPDAGVTVDLALTSAQDTGQGMDTFLGIEDVSGSERNDRLSGNDEANELIGADGDDILSGRGGSDDLSGGGGADIVRGGLGDDILDGGSSVPYIYTYAPLTAFDLVAYDDIGSGVTVDLTISGAQNTGGGGTDIIAGFHGIIGSNFDDTLTGDYGQNLLRGMDGDDVLSAGARQDTLEGGAGDDTLDGGSAQDVDTALFSGNLAQYQITTAGDVTTVIGPDGTDTLTNIEILQFADQRYFVGGTIEGNGGDNDLMGTDGVDFMFGFGGDDIFRSGGGSDYIDGGDGVDTVDLSAYARAYSVFANLQTGDINAAGDQFTFTSIENLIGGAARDDFFGTDAANRFEGGDNQDRLYGYGGDDILLGGDDRDTLYGGDGDDFLAGGAGDNSLHGDAGNDTASFYDLAAGVTVTLATTSQQTINPGNRVSLYSIENLIGSDFDDNLTGSNADNRMEGGLGDDVMDGGAGFDTASYAGAAGGVTVSLGTAGIQDTGAAGMDTLTGFEALEGSRFDDALSGSSAGDTLRGGDGLDRLTGGAGDDTLDGGSNIDTAVFSGNFFDYVISTSGYSVTVSGPDGTDTLTNVEFFEFADRTWHWRPGLGLPVNFASDPDGFMSNIRDFDGNNLGAPNSWELIGSADIQGDGDLEYLFFNRDNGRWASVGPAPDGLVYFSDHGWAGDTRVVGIYIDPLVQSGEVVRGSDHDSQRRFQNDINIGNIAGILGADDYDGDGLQEVYFSLTDGTAYLHAYMHADGNIRYANYQNQQQVIDYLTDNGYSADTWDGWFDDASPLVSADDFAAQ